MKQLNFGSTNGVQNDPNKTVAHCPTQELAQTVLRIADSEYSEYGRMEDKWIDEKENTCYNLRFGTYSGLKFYKSEGYTILPAEEFIRLNTPINKPGTEVINPFKNNDRVFHHLSGWGNVYGFSGDEIKVGLDSGDFKYFNWRELSFTPYTLQGFSHERPKPEIKEGQLIYVKDHRGEWRMRFFSNWDDGMPSCYDDQKKEGSTYTWPEYSLTNPLEEK